MLFIVIEKNKDNGFEGKIIILRLSGDVQEVVRNTVVGFKREVWEGNIDQWCIINCYGCYS